MKLTGKASRTEVYTYTYDEKDRLSKIMHKLGSTEVTLASYTYDNKGRMASKKLHGSSTNTLTYSYNIRNWLTGISSTKFTQTLGYGSHYNGNISSMNWTANGSSHSYTFTYDGVNRMLNATHGTGAYTEKVTLYDKNGNIKALQRYGNGLIDNLTYTYSGNQLTRVDDATGNAAGFSNGASAANEYTYDNNGNLTKDSNKGITSIAYNSLNLPSKVTFSDGSTIVYTYAADGTKLRTVHTISGTTTQKDYCGNVVYENGVQKLLLTEEGYVDLSNSSYYYYLKDHQGNNRVVVSSGGTVAEVNHYYPFGGVFASTGNVQPYKYNGKELDTKKGLNWYDYGARHYDASLGRFMTQDRFAEKYSDLSPYQYGANNPVCNVDVNGDSIRVYTEITSNYGLGHAWISAGEGENMIVYTYGRYDGTNKGGDGSSNSLANGPGVLLRLPGEKGKEYNNTKITKNEVSVFTISDASDIELIEYMDNIFNASTQKPQNPNGDYYNNSNARIIDEYSLLKNNCSTKVSEALNKINSKTLEVKVSIPVNNYETWQIYTRTQTFNTPRGLQNHLNNIFKRR